MGNIDNAAPNNVIFIQFNHFMGPKCSKGATIKDFFIVQQEMGVGTAKRIGRLGPPISVSRYVALCSSSNQFLSVAYTLSMKTPTLFPSMEMPLPTPAI